MRRAIFALLAVTAVAASSGCCCLERMFSCNGCNTCGGCGNGSCGWKSCNYGGGCGDSCGCGGGCSDGNCGCSAGVQNCDGCNNCGVVGNKNGGNYSGDPNMFADGGNGGGGAYGDGSDGGYGVRNPIGPGYGPRTRGCPHCGGRGCGFCMHGHHRNSGGQMEPNPGPPTAQVTYPYYTTRGPRDFLAKNPMGIGP